MKSAPAKDTAPILLKAIADDRSSEVRTEAAYALGSIGHNDAAVMDGLRAALNDANADVKKAAQDSLGLLKEQPKATPKKK